MSEKQQTQAEREALQRDTTAGSHVPPATSVPKGADGPVPHEETLGALPVVPKDVAEEYNRTGKTPKSYVSKVVNDPAERERMGVPANSGTGGQAQFPEDQEKAAKEQQRQVQREAQRDNAPERPTQQPRK